MKTIANEDKANQRITRSKTRIKETFPARDLDIDKYGMVSLDQLENVGMSTCQKIGKI